jgi:hypothetical protein
VRLAAAMRVQALSIRPVEATFLRRGFPIQSAAARDRLEAAGRSFLDGYNVALGLGDGHETAVAIEQYTLGQQGFAFEGAAMALAIIDLATPWRARRLADFLETPQGDRHVYMIHVGAGWALARVPIGRWRYFNRLDPLLRMLAIDGFGFHSGYFQWKRFIRGRDIPRAIHADCRYAFDQGLGRSVWFVCGANTEMVVTTVNRFAVDRRPDLWSGVGLAATYAGGADEESLHRLGEAAGSNRSHVALGAAFAAAARRRAGNVLPETEAACQVLCGRSVEHATQLAEEARQSAISTSPAYSYQTWQAGLRSLLA